MDERMIKPAVDAKEFLQPLKKTIKKREDKKVLLLPFVLMEPKPYCLTENGSPCCLHSFHKRFEYIEYQVERRYHETMENSFT